MKCSFVKTSEFRGGGLTPPPPVRHWSTLVLEASVLEMKPFWPAVLTSLSQPAQYVFMRTPPPNQEQNKDHNL